MLSKKYPSSEQHNFEKGFPGGSREAFFSLVCLCRSKAAISACFCERRPESWGGHGVCVGHRGGSRHAVAGQKNWTRHCGTLAGFDPAQRLAAHAGPQLPALRALQPKRKGPRLMPARGSLADRRCCHAQEVSLPVGTRFPARRACDPRARGFAYPSYALRMGLRSLPAEISSWKDDILWCHDYKLLQ